VSLCNWIDMPKL